MKTKITQITLVLFIVDILLLIININYRDQSLSVVPGLNSVKFFFYLGTLSFTVYLILAKLKKAHTIILIIATTSLSFSMYSNLLLAKSNYDRIQCLDGISEYFKYFEFDSCLKIEQRFKEDVKNKEIKYFLDEYNLDSEFKERIRDKHHVELIGVSCTRFTSMNCYNDLVKEYIKSKK